MVDSVSTRLNAALRTQTSNTTSLKPTRTGQDLIDQLRQPTTVSVTSKPLASTSGAAKPPTNLPRGSLVDISV